MGCHHHVPTMRRNSQKTHSPNCFSEAGQAREQIFISSRIGCCDGILLLPPAVLKIPMGHLPRITGQDCHRLRVSLSYTKSQRPKSANPTRISHRASTRPFDLGSLPSKKKKTPLPKLL